MLKVCSILLTRLGLALCTVALLGCGQKGHLYRPTEETAQGRATLIESLTPEALRSQGGQPPDAGLTQPWPFGEEEITI